jgi:hypothetical protein
MGNGEVAGYALTGLGKANYHAGRPEQARRYLEEAAASKARPALRCCGRSRNS